jgi:uncharacterized membrane protein
MNKTEFLDLLRYYFRNARKSEVEEILSDYEAHFEEGKKQGLSEEEIARELGSPKDIYESYQSEGVVDEKSRTLKDTAENVAKTAQETAEKAWDGVSPHLPEAAEATARLTARLLTAAGIITGVIIVAATALVIALLSANFTPFHGMPPLPRFSTLTFMSAGGFGLFSALSIYFIAREGALAIESRLTGRGGKDGADS